MHTGDTNVFFVVLACHQLVLDDSFDIIMPHLSNSAFDKSQGRGRESNPGPMGEKQERYPLCYAAP